MLIDKNTSSAGPSIFVYLSAGGHFRDKNTGNPYATTINHEIINTSVLDFCLQDATGFCPRMLALTLLNQMSFLV